MRIENPATGDLLREVTEDTADSIGEKYQRARAAQPDWAARPISERLGVIQRFRELVVERTEQMARTLTSEMGKPITQAKNELGAFLDRIDFFLEKTPAELEPKTVLESEGLIERIAHEPLGVVANVSAWNYPYFVGGNVFLPALLTGNAVLYKPSELSTLSGLEIASALHDAGLPQDLFSVVIGAGQVGKLLLDQPIDAAFFTGSYATGKQIAKQLAPRLVKLQLELGGKDPAYVTDDVNVQNAAESVADGAFYNAGQSCCAVERVYVHASVWDPFVEAFVAAVKGFRVGDPMDPDTYLGPLARGGAQLELLEAQVQDAQRLGARVLTGGKRADRAGWFEPTVLVDVTHQMRVMREESFGPIIGLMKVNDDLSAIELMNDTEYGLTAGVFSRDQARAERILARLQVGSAYYNCSDRVSPRLPWTGRRHSGIGVTLSRYGIETFLAPKAWHLKAPA